MGVTLRGTAAKKRHGRGWRRRRDRGGTPWARRKALSAAYCGGSVGGPPAARPVAGSRRTASAG